MLENATFNHNGANRPKPSAYTIMKDGVHYKKRGSEEERVYPFEQVTEEEALKRRYQAIRDDKTLFVWRCGGKIYIAEVFYTFSVHNTPFSKQHLCCWCERCSAAEISNGGCEKVRDRFMRQVNSVERNSLWGEPSGLDGVERQQKNRLNDFKEELKESSRVEKYQFLRDSFEIVNGKSDVFFVGACTRFMKFRPRQTYSPGVKMRKLIELEDMFHGVYPCRPLSWDNIRQVQLPKY